MFIGNHYIDTDNPSIPQVGSEWSENVLPEDIARGVIHAGLLNQVLETFTTLPNGKIADAPVTLRAGYAYTNRRGELSYDALDGDRNKNYASKNDPIVLQISVVVEPETEAYTTLAKVGHEAQAEELRKQAEDLREREAKLAEEKEALRAQQQDIAEKLEKMGF